MRVWCDVYDANYNRLGSGPVTAIKQATFARKLDGAGTFQLSAVGVDEQALTLLTNERRVRIYGETLAGNARLLGDGIIRQRNLTEQSGSVQLQITGVDALDELKRVNVLLARTYTDTVQNVVDDLMTLMTGWTADVDSAIASNTIDVRYDGVSVLAALQAIADRYGYHLRLSNTATRTIEISEFGDSNGLRISKVDVITTETILNDELLMVQRLVQGQTTEQVYNWMMPIGAGEGTAALTLEKSTRTSPYTIQTTTGPDGRTLYYISDSTSIAEYGEIQRVAQFKQIAPSANSAVAIRAAANALYDAAVEALQRAKQPQEHYNVVVKNAQQSLQPGDKIELDYKAQVKTSSGLVDYLNIRDSFWILDVNETVGTGGSSATLTISNIDQRVTTPAEQVMNAIEQISLKNLQPTTTGSVRSYVYDREMDSTHNVTIPIEFTDATLYAQRVRLRLKTSPFRSTANAAASGGSHTHSVTIPSHTHSVTTSDHRHQMLEWLNPSTPPATMATQRWIAQRSNSSSSSANYELQISSFSYVDGTPRSTEIWTYAAGGGETTTSASGGGTTQTSSADGTHTHDIEYAITDDTEHPQSITVSVNGVDKTLALFGSATLAGSNAAIDVIADADELTTLLQNASGGLRQEHEITIDCGSGQGRIEATVEIYEITQTIIVV